MSSHHEHPTPSKVAFLQHPLHPMVVVFPVAFLLSVVATDAVFWWRGEAFWALASFWLSAAGFVTGVLAALLGFADFVQMKEVRRQVTGWSHFVVGIMTLSLAGANAQMRLDDPVGAVLPWGIVLSTAMMVMVIVTGWLGGTLTFRYGIGTYSVASGDAGDEDGSTQSADTK